jgi:hypothetical protein
MKLIVLKYSKKGIFDKYDALELYNAIVSVYNEYDIIELKLINNKCSIEFIKYLFFLLWNDFGIDEIMGKIRIYDERILSKIEIIGSIYA